MENTTAFLSSEQSVDEGSALPTSSDIYLSVVVPLYNEESNVQPLLVQLENTLHNLGVSYEIILVDDGSRDRTWHMISDCSSSMPAVRGVKLVRNFGHQHALLAGLASARGQAIVSMDGDLQHPPALIQEMLAQYQKGYLVVNTCRHDRETVSAFKRISSSSFYKVFSFLSDVPMEAGASDFRLMDRSVLKHILAIQDVDIFIRGTIEWLGFSCVTIPYNAGKRFSGKTKYNLLKMFRFAGGSIISFSTKPLIIGVWIGLLTSSLAFLEIIYILFQYANGRTVPGWASTVGVISFLFGILFVILGIIGAYLSRIHLALQNRPKFIVESSVERKTE
ncbi:glycosyltransferase family 2 protein [Desulforhopalus sp. IMCC35007]|uniref:glycosyltransferase family 2 protein n=1 Tax=Desulforhopalus sp. IMCC35007 TaxID=2569543 RepID=UPI0010ADDA19|nr:glycosyltransferase family 2 protein [Desulforhopalus sp. IMCC35007]TKB08399.1 glycosyltransferase family 2 protein [Desulforhopalus sp. IMCC35007]